MYKDYELEVAAGTTAAEPTEYPIEFLPVTIERVTIAFPRGPNREVYVRILHEAEFVFPQDPGEWINGEEERVIITGPWHNWDNLYTLRIQLCSPAARLSHKIIFRFDLAELEDVGTIRSTLEKLIGTFLPIPED